MNFGTWVIRNRWWIIWATLVITAVAGSGIRFLTFANDYRAFFKKDNPHLRAFESLGNSYTFTDDVLIVLAPRDGKVFNRKTLTAVKETTRLSWLTPYSVRADSLTNYLHTRAEGDHLISEFLVKNPQSLSDLDIKRAETLVLSDPSNAHRLVSPSGHTTGIHVTIFFPGKSENELIETVNHVRKIAVDIETKFPDIDVYLGGSVMLSNAFKESAQGDFKTIIPGMYGVVIIVLAMILRSFPAVFVVILVILFAETTAIGLAGWLGISVSAVSVHAPTIIMTVGVAGSIHILLTFFYRMRQGDNKDQALAESLRINFKPVIITNAATIISFVCLNFNNSPPYRDLGNVVALGVTASLLATIFLLPALMSILPVKRRPEIDSGHGFTLWLGNFVVIHRGKFFWGILGLISVMLASLPSLQLNDKLTDFFHERVSFHKNIDFIATNFTGITTIDYSFDTNEKRGIVDPKYLDGLDRFAGWYLDQSGVVFVNTVSDIIKRVNRSMHGDDDSFYRVPKIRELTAANLFLYEMSLPDGFDLDTFIRPDESATRFTGVLGNVSIRDLLQIEERAQTWLGENAPKEFSATGSGPFILFAHLADENIRNMVIGSVAALAMISILLIFPFGSIKLGLISLIPNLVPAGMAFGMWGWLCGNLGLGASVVVVMSLGIVVDDTIYFLVSYVRSRKEGKSSPEAVVHSFQTVGTALCVTTLILATGFLVLLFSGFAINSRMGMLTALTILFALVLDLLFLPTLLMKMDKTRHEKISV